jgi:hypothetical protein
MNCQGYELNSGVYVQNVVRAQICTTVLSAHISRDLLTSLTLFLSESCRVKSVVYCVYMPVNKNII